MSTLTIDYEGRTLRPECEPGTTHVVVSERKEGGLRIQPTDDPLHALTTAQGAGDRHCRMAAVEGLRAEFPPLVDYDPDAAEREALRRDKWLQLLLMAVVAAVVALAVAVIWVF